MFYVGDQNQVIAQYESGTYANRSGTAFWLGGTAQNELKESTGIIDARYVGDGTRNVTQFLPGPQRFDGTLSFDVQDWRVLKFLLGSLVDGGSPSPYQHNYAESNNNMQTPEILGQSLPTFTIEDIQRTVTGSNFGRRLNGCMIDEATFTFEERVPVRAEVNYVGQTMTFFSGAATAVTADSTRPFMWSDSRIDIPSGTQLSRAKNINVKVSNNLDVPHYVDGNRLIGTPIPTMRDYEVTMTLNGDDAITKVLYDQFYLGGSAFNMLLTSIISTGSEALAWTFSGCYLTEWSAASPNSGVNEHNVTIRPTSSSAIEFDSVQYKNAGSYAGF